MHAYEKCPGDVRPVSFHSLVSVCVSHSMAPFRSSEVHYFYEIRVKLKL